jgi:hypothetical protein
MDAFQPLINLLVLLSALSLAAERVTNVIKLRYDTLRDKGANEKKEKERERDVTQVNLGIAILVALVLKADFFEILGNLQAPWDTLGWAHMQAGDLVRRSALTNWGQGLYALVGSVFTGLALGFGSKFWHDMLDIVFNSREWLKKGAKA